MYDELTAELIVTSDGVIKNIVFVGGLVTAALAIKGWKLTTSKPELDIKDVGIRMDGYTFAPDNVQFVTNNHEEYPDEIDICIVFDDYKTQNKLVGVVFPPQNLNIIYLRSNDSSGSFL